MPEQLGLTRGQYLVILVIVSAVAGVVAGALGSAASLFYGWYSGISLRLLYDEFGMYWGAFTGIVAAIFWCRMMDRRVRKHGDYRVVVYGGLAGIMAGVISTTLLHAGLIVVSQRAEWKAILLCETCGAVAGLVVGFFAAAGVRAISLKPEPPLSAENVETES